MKLKTIKEKLINISSDDIILLENEFFLSIETIQNLVDANIHPNSDPFPDEKTPEIYKRVKQINLNKIL